jgi:alanine-glyoxylate transaminase/serine-glyoxylate transaminase/serine-pyruvate transaminase
MEPGEQALVLNAGYFGDAVADCYEVYGAKVTQLRAPVGDRPGPEDLEAALRKQKYKTVTFTHVDTSTGVLTDAQAVAETVKRLSPDSLIILDGVCSVGSEEIRFDDWGIDVVIAASQKGLGVPPGLSVTCVSQRALAVLKARKTPVTSYFASWNRWLPIMQAYDKGAAAYFATPPVNLINALNTSLTAITEKPPTLAERFALHKEVSQRVKAEGAKLGLKQVPLHPHASANGMTAFYAPDGIKVTDIVPGLLKRGVVVAAGLHKDIKGALRGLPLPSLLTHHRTERYFRCADDPALTPTAS